MTNDHNDRVLMGFNVEELRRVADCLRVLNPARAPNADGTMRYIAAHAKAQLPDKPGYVETMGFCITAYHDHTGRLLYKVTLSSYGVAEYIAGVQRANELHATEYGKLHALVGVTTEGNTIAPFDPVALRKAFAALSPHEREMVLGHEVLWQAQFGSRKKDLEP